jgi:GT2 family glycosyltransferase
MRLRVLVSIVTYNSGPILAACLQSLKAQTSRDFITCVWDNASTDETPDVIAANQDCIHAAHFSTQNIGFCAGQNRLIASDDSEYVLALNPDVLLQPQFIETLVQAIGLDIKAGSASGKLWRWEGSAEPGVRARILDTAGMYFTPNQRHLDRGSGERDCGQFEKREYVFGASGAAAFYRRQMLDEIQCGQEYFDEAFFAYREDADLAWRAQWLGWRCLYVPEATGFHVRRVLPERRATLPAEINMHSFKNRFLMRIKNMDRGTYLRFVVPISFRDLAGLAYVIAKERTSLRAIPLLIREFPRAWSLRKALQRRCRVPAKEIRSWFSTLPVSKTAGGL